MRQLDDFLAGQKDLTQLCLLKARPTVIRDLVHGGLPSGTIFAMYRKINGKAPPRGQFPQEIRTCLANPKKRLQASVLICVFERLQGVAESSTERYIKAYEQYLITWPDNPSFDFNRAWFILRQFTQKRIAVTNCRCCSHRYAYNREDVSDLNKCPVCALVRIKEVDAPSTDAPFIENDVSGVGIGSALMASC